MRDKDQEPEIIQTPLMRVALHKRRDARIQEKLLEDSATRHAEIALSAKEAREEYTAILAALTPDEEADLLQVILTDDDQHDPFAFLRRYNAGLV